MNEQQKIRPLRAKTMTVEGLQADTLKVLRRAAKRLRCATPHLQNITDKEFVEKVIEPLISNIETDQIYREGITTREIVAAARVRFEEWVEEHAVTTDMTQRDQGGGYAIILIHWSWQSWCAALGIDPMGDCK